LIYDTVQERTDSIAPLVKAGLESGDLVMYIANEGEDKSLLSALKKSGVEVKKYLDNGSLILTDRNEIFFKLGRLDPDWSVRVINNVAELAKEYGIGCVRILTDMTWIGLGLPGSNRWAEYEAKVSALDPGIAIKSICLFDRSAIPPEWLLAAVKVHPKVASHGSICKNRLFVPADLMIQGDHSGVELDRMLDAIMTSSTIESDVRSRQQEMDQVRKKLENESAARKRMESSLEESRRRLSEFAERSSDWMWETGADLTYTYSSFKVEDLLGLRPEEIMGKRPQDLVLPSEADKVTNTLARSVQLKEPIITLEKEARHRDGRRVVLEMSAIPQFDRDGNFLGFRGADRDITWSRTHKAEMEESLKKAMEEARKTADNAALTLQEREKRIMELEKEISTMRTAQAEWDAALAAVNEVLSAREKEVLAAKEEIERQKNYISSRDRELANARRELDDYRSQAAGKEAIITRLQELDKSKSADLDAAKEELETVREVQVQKDVTLAKLQQELGAKTAELQSTRESLTNSRELIAQKEVALSRLRDETQARSVELINVRRTLETQKALVVELEQKNDELQKAADEARKSALEHEAEEDRLTSELEAMKIELAKAWADLKDKSALAEAKDLEARELGEKVKLLDEELKAAKETNLHQTAELEDLEKRVQELNANLTKARSELATLRVLNDRAKVDLEEKTAEAEALRTELKSVSDLAASTSLKLNHSEKLLAEARKDIEARDEELAAANEEMTELRKDVDGLEVDLAAAQAANEAVKGELAKRDAELTAARIEVTDTLAVVEATRSQLRAQTEETESVKKSLEAAKAERDEKARLLRAETEQLQAANEAIQAAKAESVRAAIELSDRDALILSLKAAAVMADSAIANLRDTTERNVLEIEEKAREVTALKSEMINKEAELADSRMQFSHQLDETARLTAMIAALNAKLEGYENESRAARAAELARDREAIEESQDRYRAILANAGVAIARTDIDGRIIESNARLRELLDRNESELKGMTLQDNMHRDDLAQVSQLHADLLSGDKRSGTLNVRLERRMGAIVHASLSMSVVRDGAGVPKYMMSLIEDRTEQVLAEKALQDKEEADLAAARSGLAETQGELAAELNDKLTVIMGSTCLAEQFVIPEGQMYDKLKQIESASATARDLASRLMASPAMEEGFDEQELVRGSGRILLMDDDEGVLDVIGDLLRHLGYEVGLARDAEEALSKARAAYESGQPYKLAILDLTSKDGHVGSNVAGMLQEASPGIKLAASSGLPTEPAMTEPVSHGFDIAISKPYQPKALSRTVADVLSG